MARSIDRIQPQLEALFKRHFVQLAYLFGSQSSGYSRDDSDVDIAVLFGGVLSSAERCSESQSILEDLISLLRRDDVDLVILNEASPLLAFEVLENGRLLYCASEADRIEFQVSVIRLYEDTAPLRKILADAMEERLRAKAFGKPVLRQKSAGSA